MKTVEILSARNTFIPAILTLPANVKNPPVVLMAHGHGGSKDENGLFVLFAESMAKAGIATLRMDFPGCGDSKESFVENNRLSFMLADVASCKDWLVAQNIIDKNRMGIFGYSMGGRIAAVAVSEDPQYKAAAFLSPAVFSGVLVPGDADASTLYETAKKEGKATFTTFWRTEQTLGVGYFDDMQNIPPLDKIDRFKGDLLLVTGSADVVIPPATAELLTKMAVNVRSSKTLEVPEAGHDYGFASGSTDITMQAVDAITDFFKAKI